MSNKNNELESGENFDTDLGFDDGDNLQPQKNNKALIKVIGVAVGLVAVVVGIYMFTGTGQQTGPQSQIANTQAGQNAGLPAQKEPTPEYRQALENYNQQIIEEAKESGQSVVPIPVDPLRQQMQTQIQEAQEDPAERFRRIQEEYRRQQELQTQVQQSQQTQVQVENEAEIIQNKAQAMSSYLTSAMSSRQPRGTSSLAVSYTPPPDPVVGEGGSGEVDAQGNPVSGGAGPGATLADAKVLLPATTIEYGQLLIEANTDAPGPVLAMVASGKFAGGRLLGSFQETEKFLTINFSQLVTKDGKTIPIQAIVLDPTSTLPGVITEIDNRYFRRYILPAAADFVSGVGEALAQTQQETTQNVGATTTASDEPDFSEAIAQGISDSFDGLSEAISESNEGVRPMLRVAAGTPIGILFLQDVLDPKSVRDIQAQMAEDQEAGDPYGNMMANNGQAMFPSMMMPYPMMPYGAAPGMTGSVPSAAAPPPSATGR